VTGGGGGGRFSRFSSCALSARGVGLSHAGDLRGEGGH
jgi:hypothetical protein